jgi:hypothetical protein
MDLNQRKLTRSEWESIEVPVSSQEKDILNLIIQGYDNVNIKYNKYNSLFHFLKIDYNETMEDHLYNKYFAPKINEMKKKYTTSEEIFNVHSKSNPNIKKADIIRIEKNDTSKLNADIVYEYLLLNNIEEILKYKQTKNSKWLFHYFSLSKLIKNTISNLNRHIVLITNNVLSSFEEDVDMTKIIENSVDFIEKNELILKYSDMTLYEHQKKIFNIMQNPDFDSRLDLYRKELKIQQKLENNDDYASDDSVEETKNSIVKNIQPNKPKIVLYIAPTGTGKTLTPIGVSEKNRVIFVCAARHVGLALARSAISVGKKIAFAFGCSSAHDIRLHYFAAKEYTTNKRSGQIKKVDNSVGDKVEIIICDLKSYLPAMYYMKAFNPIENIVTYWDEPTITLDYENHELHKIIQENWTNNLIPNMILSSATLPKLHELTDTLEDFKNKFAGANVYNIVSHDCKKSIPILNKNGYIVLPHYLSTEYSEVLQIVEHCESNLTLLRYFDLKEIVDFILFVNKNDYCMSNMKIKRNFPSLDEVNMQNIKLYYLKLLKNIVPGTWGAIYISLKQTRTKRILPNDTIDPKGVPIKNVKQQVVQNTNDNESGNCALYVSTKDAYTLTDGPTLFLAEDVEKIAKFCIQQANIPSKVMEDIVEKINFNNGVNEKIVILERDLEDTIEKKTMKEHMSDDSFAAKKFKSEPKSRDKDFGEKDKDINKINNELEILRSMIKPAELNETFIPNKPLHLKKWAEHMNTVGAFTSDIDENIVVEIMMLTDVADSWKILLLMGIGVFTNHPSITYTEIMKKMADSQKLYMIIGSSDYIYGTNYQFCHAYLSKDMKLTQEKIIQAMGRIGRNNVQQNYTIRFRDDEQIKNLFYKEEDKIEVKNMNILFSSCKNI